MCDNADVLVEYHSDAIENTRRWVVGEGEARDLALPRGHKRISQGLEGWAIEEDEEVG
jgi:hypothetical protein